MHQLIGRRRPGLPAQSAQLCTTCLVVLSRPLQSAALASAASSAHYTTSAPRWMRAARIQTACPALQWRQLRRYTTPTRPMFRPVESADATSTQGTQVAAELVSSEATEATKATTEAKEKKKKAKAKKEKDAKTKSKAKAGDEATTEGQAKPPPTKSKAKRKAARAAQFKTSATAVAAAAMLKTGMYQKQVKLWTETLNVLTKLEATQDQLAKQAASKAATAAKTAKEYEAVNAQIAAEMAGSSQSQGAAGDADGETESTSTEATTKAHSKAGKTVSATDIVMAELPVDSQLPADVKVRQRAEAAETLAAKAAADAKAAQAAVAAAKDAQTQVKLLTNALHLLKNALSFPESEKSSTPSQPSSKSTHKTSSSGSSDTAPFKITYEKGTTPSALHTRKKLMAENNSITSTYTQGANASPDLKIEDRDHSTTDRKSNKSEKSDKAPPKTPNPPNIVGLKNAKYMVSKVNTKSLALNPIDENMRDVPRLSYGLDRALFNPGVYHLQDPHSRVYNFDPYLATIMPLREFDFNALKQYVTSSKDTMLTHMAHKHKMRYSGSTSSMTSMLSHFHFLLSAWRPINPANVSRNFQPESYNYTRITRAPAAIFLHWKPEAESYAIDADKQFDSANILSMLGKSMEKLLTLSKEDFEKYRVTRSHELTDAERNDPEAFHYTTFGDFMMRSQLDAHDERLPGTGMFDLKTRAVVSIRMDAQDFQKGLGYEIRSRYGQYESFEREYYDMIRSAFIKYSLQVRMGRMDGIYVAFHNTERIFGFQYISINEMDLALHGTEDRTIGDREFMVSLKMLNDVLDRATKKFPNQSLRMHFETRPSDSAPFMYVFAEPVTPEEIEAVQSSNKAEIEEFERNMMGLNKNEAGDALIKAAQQAANDMADEAEAETMLEDDDEAITQQIEEELARQEEEENDEDELDSLSVWESMRQRVEETMENEEQGIEYVRDTIEDALEQSGLLTGRSVEETREYVEALLGAVIATDTKAAAETIYKDAKSEEAPEVDVTVESEVEAVVEADAETAIKAEPETAEQEAPATETAEPAAIEPTETEAVTETETKVETPEAEISVEDDIVIEEPIGTEPSDAVKVESAPAESGDSAPSPSDNISLKDLIMKLAAQVESAQTRDASVAATASASKSASAATESPADEESPESADFSSPDDAPKNKRFERILSELLAKSSPKTTKKAEAEAAAEAAKAAADKAAAKSPVMGMIVTIRNRVNGKYVSRPERLTKSDNWTVEYAVEDMKNDRARSIYDMLKSRRKNLMSKPDMGDDDDEPMSSKQKRSATFNRDYLARLYKLSAKGRQYRHKQNLMAQSYPLNVYGMGKFKWTDVFQAPTEEGSEKKKKKSKELKEIKTGEVESGES